MKCKVRNVWRRMIRVRKGIKGMRVVEVRGGGVKRGIEEGEIGRVIE